MIVCPEEALGPGWARLQSIKCIKNLDVQLNIDVKEDQIFERDREEPRFGVDSLVPSLRLTVSFQDLYSLALTGSFGVSILWEPVALRSNTMSLTACAGC